MFLIVSLLAAALSGGVLADAQTAVPAEPAAHLLLVPDTPAGAAALSRADVRVVARYESFALVETAGEDERRLRAAGAQRRDDMREVGTAAGSIDPEADRQSLAGKRAGDPGEVLALVQFVGPPKDPWVERLAATGARIVTYQAENAYVVHAGGPAVDRLAGLVGTDPAVRAVIALGPLDKLEGHANGAARYAVSTVSGPIGERARAAAVAAGPVVGAGATVGAVRTQYLELSPAEVDELARDPALVAIERDLLPAPSDERTSQIVAGNLGAPAFTEPSGPGYLAWHDPRFGATTFPFAVDVTDTGLDNGADPPQHPDFRELGAGVSRLAYRQNLTADSNTRDCTGHGTNVASIAAGYNNGAGGGVEDAGGFNYGLGVAPLAQIGVSKIFNCAGNADPGFDSEGLTSSAYGLGARISNNSWGTGTGLGWGSYTSRAQLYDRLVRDAQPGTAGNQQMVEVFSAGNDGDVGYSTIHAEATAKNVISVGASEGVRGTGTDGCGTLDSEADSARDIVSFSSRGPTEDGRLKPDLVAPGTHVTGARPQHGDYAGQGTCNPIFVGLYSLVSGTSQAAPQVTGAAALVRDWYQDTRAAEASPALTKALLINTASDLAGGQNGKGDVIAGGPNDDQGWGRVNLGAALDSTPREFYDQLAPGDVLGAAGQTVVRTFAVQDASKPVKVTVAWTDPPGPTTGNAFVNNLDLEVGAGGRAYLGNVFAGSYSRTGGAADPRNNVESVYLPPGTSGRVSVTVRATSLLGNGLPGNPDATDQDFALVVSNAAEQAAPVLLHEDSTVAGGDGDGVLESAEQVQLTEEVRNAGEGDATGVSATLAGSGGLTVSQGNSTYPTIAEDDGVEANATPFTVQLANAATCGADAGATLSITSGADTQTVPLVLPTGEEAPSAQTHSAGSPQVPLGIPDDSAAGVASAVFVGERGRIKDLDVAIGGLSHSWVGDLVIDITGPDGTTVRLADHPGGPDNDDDNLAGTTFDDEAPVNISAGSGPYTGSFRPQNDQLSRFDGKSRRGTWTLRVRDLFEGDVGVLNGWGVVSRKAVCDVDTVAPDTSISGGPASPTTATSAQFTLGSDDGGATFECSLDGAPYEPCGTTAAFSGLGPGTHTVSARAIDGSDNEDATPASYSWTIQAPPGPPPPPPPPPPAATPAASFLLVPAEENLAEALAGRLTVLAACSAACRTSATIRVSARTAQALGLGRRAVSLGSGTKGRASPGTANVAVRLSGRARAALRGRRLTETRLKVTLTVGSSRLTFTRSLDLRRGAWLAHIASRGLPLWAACARSCPLRAALTLSAAEARRLGLRPGTAARYELAARRISATRTPKLLKLSVRRSARRPLAGARRVGALLTAVAGTTPQPLRTARLSKTLRR